MEAILDIQSKQYKVKNDQILYVDKLPDKVGSEVSLSNILCIYEGGKIQIGNPYLKKASVTAKILEEIRGPKIKGFKYKKRKNYRRSWGHRQNYYKLQIKSISI